LVGDRSTILDQLASGATGSGAPDPLATFLVATPAAEADPDGVASWNKECLAAAAMECWPDALHGLKELIAPARLASRDRAAAMFACWPLRREVRSPFAAALPQGLTPALLEAPVWPLAQPDYVETATALPTTAGGPFGPLTDGELRAVDMPTAALQYAATLGLKVYDVPPALVEDVQSVDAWRRYVT
jgi:hypothetical protein